MKILILVGNATIYYGGTLNSFDILTKYSFLQKRLAKEAKHRGSKTKKMLHLASKGMRGRKDKKG